MTGHSGQVDAVRRVAEERGFTGLRAAGSGLEFAAYRAFTEDGSEVVLRVPVGGRFDGNANDPLVDTRELLRWEHAVSGHLTRLGFPVARPRELVLGERDVLITQYVPDDGEPADQVELGRLLRALHELPPPRRPPAAQEGLLTAELLPRRLVRRWHELEQLVPDLPAAPPAGQLAAALAGADANSLVHLDVRDDNLRCVSGRVRAVLDWSNALIADGDLELCRLSEFARIPANRIDIDAVTAGYGAAIRGDAASWTYRLDAAVMLAVVFLTEAPDERLGSQAVDRLLRVHHHLTAALRGS